MGIIQRYRDFEHGKTLPDPLDLTNPEHRKVAQFHHDWADHQILRRRWTNFCEIAPGVYRSNQPTHERWEEYAKLGIKTVINLRGASPKRPHFLFEVESLEKLGIQRLDIPLHARSAPPMQSIQALLEAFRTIDRPFLMHCKSGADRAGLASVLYKLLVEKAPLAEARKMLSLRFLHVKWHTTGVLDYFLDVYEACNAKSPIAFEDWLRLEYDEAALNAGFKDGRKIPQ